MLSGCRRLTARFAISEFRVHCFALLAVVRCRAIGCTSLPRVSCSGLSGVFISVLFLIIPADCLACIRLGSRAMRFYCRAAASPRRSPANRGRATKKPRSANPPRYSRESCGAGPAVAAGLTAPDQRGRSGSAVPCCGNACGRTAAHPQGDHKTPDGPGECGKAAARAADGVASCCI